MNREDFAASPLPEKTTVRADSIQTAATQAASPVADGEALQVSRDPAEAAARDALRAGDPARALTAAQILAGSDDPVRRASGLFLTGLARAESGALFDGLACVADAVAIDPRAEFLAQWARLLIMVRREGEAASAAQRALAAGPPDALTFDTLGCVLARLGDHESSHTPFSRAVDLEPANSAYRFNLAAACGFTGRIADARRHYEAILEHSPADSRVHYALSILSRQTQADNHVGRLQDVLAAGLPARDELRIRYALAKELEDLGRGADAFAHLSAANLAHKRSTRYDFSTDAAIFDAIERAFSNISPKLAPSVLAKQGEGDDPIFIVGMPRTGTTLVDRILSSHRDVESAGELQAMPLAVKQAAGTRSRTVIDPETIAAAMRVDPRVIADAYRARANHHRRGEAARFTDKLPANFLYAGHILRAMPQARIVCLRRDPLDTVWSNFRNLFAVSSAYYAYSYDLVDIARYYHRFDRLMALWERLFPGRILQIGYEALVHDQEAETRRLLTHCGLSWDPGCLDFHRNTAAVATPSAAQVRRPLNADGIGRWRNHEAAMGPVRAFFAEQGIMTH